MYCIGKVKRQPQILYHKLIASIGNLSIVGNIVASEGGLGNRYTLLLEPNTEEFWSDAQIIACRLWRGGGGLLPLNTTIMCMRLCTTCKLLWVIPKHDGLNET